MKKPLKGRKRKVKMEFSGDVKQDDLLIGSHGDTDIKIKGNFEISGIIYSPKYTVTFEIKGDGQLTFRGKCHKIVIKKMQGNCLLDLSDVTYKELHCRSLQDKSVVIAGNTRAITPAILFDEAVLHVKQRQLIFNPVTSGNSQILTIDSAAEK